MLQFYYTQEIQPMVYQRGGIFDFLLQVCRYTRKRMCPKLCPAWFRSPFLSFNVGFATPLIWRIFTLHFAFPSSQVYAALLIEAIKEIEEENKAARAEANESSDWQGVMPPDDGRAEYMGWIIDDFPCTTEQVRYVIGPWG